MATSCWNGFEWEVREIDVKQICLEDILKYLENCTLKHYWVLLFHDGSVECEIIDETVPKLQYYHLFIWYHKEAETRRTKKKNYFSNLPFMQFVRRIYSKWGEIIYPHVLDYNDVIPRLVSLINSSHVLIKNKSHFPEWIKEELKEHL